MFVGRFDVLLQTNLMKQKTITFKKWIYYSPLQLLIDKPSNVSVCASTILYTNYHRVLIVKSC